jgi:hypothetical protein
MRTKTVLLSALLGALGSVSVHAQNVYSLNAVGYINVTCPPGFNMVTCPLLETDTNGNPNNTLGNVLNNANGALTGSSVYFWFPTASPPAYSEDVAKVVGTGKVDTTNANGWSFNGTNVAAPGVGFWFDNAGSNNIVLTFVGTVPTGPITNTLVSGFNLVGSAVPMSGDIVSNTISALTNYNIGDTVYTYNPLNPPLTAYTEYTSTSNPKADGHGYNGNWTTNGDPIIPNVGQGFWYDNGVGTVVHWVENYSVNP